VKRKLLTVEDYRLLAKRKLPRVAFDNIDGADESELTMRENAAVFDQVALRPRNGTRVGVPELATMLFGTTLSMPVILAPCGMARVVHPHGDIAGARAAAAVGTAFALSMMSGHAMEDVAAAASGPLWFQVYNFGGLDRTARAIDRAAKAGFQALVITLDTQVSPARLRDVRNGASTLLGNTSLRQLPYTPQLFRHPVWLARRLSDGLVPRVPNVILDDGSPGYLWKDGRPSSLTWGDFSWIREHWPGPVIAKGVLTAADANRAVECGVDAVVVSNHGGRQLDGTEPTLRALPEVVAAVGGRCAVLMDGGIRRGNDVIKAMSLGASAVMIGRPWLFALGAGGQAAIEELLEKFRADLVRDLQLMGYARPSDLDAGAVRAPAHWFTAR
jgi:isopentenyl diphosphate isomerase/L-lactate dehydrogenase-like FMN-dependent dehydrogenase